MGLFSIYGDLGIYSSYNGRNGAFYFILLEGRMLFKHI
jgi:hypothetical protein